MKMGRLQPLSLRDNKTIALVRNNPTRLQKIRSLLRLAFDGPGQTGTRTGIQRLAIPHSFNEGLGFPEAAIAVAQALLRILLGCLLFALWGTLAMWLWTTIGSHFWRGLVLIPVLALFLVSLLISMIGISVVTKAVTPKRF
jgi:hypothetical protein